MTAGPASRTDGPVDPDVAGRLVCWLAASAAGTTDDSRAVEAVQAGSDGHVVDDVSGTDARPGDGRDEPSPREAGVPLAQAWPALRAARPRRLIAVFPAPGGTVPVAGTGPFARAALDAGGGVLIEAAGERLGLVPHIDRRGSSYLGVRWQLFRSDPGAGDRPEPVGVAAWMPTADYPAEAVPRALDQADRALRRAIRAATESLGDLDLARWRPELSEHAQSAELALRAARERLPPGWPTSARMLAERALGLWRLVQLATAAEAASSSGFLLRDSALRELSHALREALAVAYNAPARLLLDRTEHQPARHYG